MAILAVIFLALGTCSTIQRWDIGFKQQAEVNKEKQTRYPLYNTSANRDPNTLKIQLSYWGGYNLPLFQQCAANTNSRFYMTMAFKDVLLKMTSL